MAPPKQRDLSAQVPLIRIQETEELPEELVRQLLREINDRQWGAVVEVLVEAKFKGESQLRNDSVYDSAGKVAYFCGWIAYADYIISSLQTLRSQPITQRDEMRPGPEM